MNVTTGSKQGNLWREEMYFLASGCDALTLGRPVVKLIRRKEFISLGSATILISDELLRRHFCAILDTWDKVCQTTEGPSMSRCMPALRFLRTPPGVRRITEWLGGNWSEYPISSSALCFDLPLGFSYLALIELQVVIQKAGRLVSVVVLIHLKLVHPSEGFQPCMWTCQSVPPCLEGIWKRCGIVFCECLHSRRCQSQCLTTQYKANIMKHSVHI